MAGEQETAIRNLEGHLQRSTSVGPLFRLQSCEEQATCPSSPRGFRLNKYMLKQPAYPLLVESLRYLGSQRAGDKLATDTGHECYGLYCRRRAEGLFETPLVHSSGKYFFMGTATQILTLPAGSYRNVSNMTKC